MSALSKTSRIAAVFLGFSMVFGLLLVFDKTAKTPNLKADILAETSEKTSATAAFLEASFEEHYQIALEQAFQDVPNAKAFLADVARWSHIADVRIQDIDGGVYVSVLAASRGDTLHEYFGFFEKTAQEITQIIWSGVLSAQLESQAKYPSGEYSTLSVINTSSVPWLTNDSWRDEIGGAEIVLLAADGGDTVTNGESATFVYKTDQEKIVPKNTTRGFLIQIQE